jgi:hypothetical protein
MATNVNFSDRVTSEQRLYEDIVIESLKMFGQDVYYLPRTLINEDTIFNEDIPSKFSNAYKIEMYIENVDGFEGEGDIFTKFGVEMRDEATFVVSRKRFGNAVIQYDNEITAERPEEGDLIYLPLSKSLFEIGHVERELPFYQLAALPTFKMRCSLFEYSDEQLDTGVTGVDDIEVYSTYQYVIGYTKPIIGTATASLSGGVVSEVAITNAGDGYRSGTPPVITVSAPSGAGGVQAAIGSTLTSGKITALTITNAGSGYASAPTITVAGPTDVEFVRGEQVSQTFASGVKMFGEVVKQNDSDALLYIAHAGADDGKFHNFATSLDITGATSFAASTVLSVTELDNSSDTEDNTDFDTDMSGFLDFSENNPFGDPE